MSQSLDQILVSLKNMNDPVIFAEAYITANYTPNSEVAEREQSLWAITYDFLYRVNKGLCDEWERVIAERAKLKEGV